MNEASSDMVWTLLRGLRTFDMTQEEQRDMQLKLQKLKERQNASEMVLLEIRNVLLCKSCLELQSRLLMHPQRIDRSRLVPRMKQHRDDIGQLRQYPDQTLGEQHLERSYATASTHLDISRS